MNRIVQPIAYTLAAIYLLVDAIFLGLAKPIANGSVAILYSGDCEPGSDRSGLIRRLRFFPSRWSSWNLSNRFRPIWPPPGRF